MTLAVALRSARLSCRECRGRATRPLARSKAALPRDACSYTGAARDDVLEVGPQLELHVGDCLVVSARRSAFSNAERDIGPELDDPNLLAVPLRPRPIVVTQPCSARRTARRPGEPSQALAACTWNRVAAGTQLIPREPWTVLQRGDILHVAGAPDVVERAGSTLASSNAILSKTDLMFLAGGVSAAFFSV